MENPPVFAHVQEPICGTGEGSRTPLEEFVRSHSLAGQVPLTQADRRILVWYGLSTKEPLAERPAL